MAAIRSSVWNHTLAISEHRDGVLRPLGSAFLIGYGWAITATHVLWDVQGSVAACQIINNRDNPLHWSVRHLYTGPSAAEMRPHDLALLKLEPFAFMDPDVERFRHYGFRVNFVGPEIGERITAYGYTKSESLNPTGDGLIFEVSHEKKNISGLVTDSFWNYRDIGMLSFPCFSVDCDFESGMSGGPILNDKNEVCGIVSSGGIGGWGSMIWPALAIKFDDVHFIDYVRKRPFQFINQQCVTFEIDKFDNTSNIIFDPNLIR